MATTEAAPESKSAFEELFGDTPIISQYTVQDGIADGTFVQLDRRLTESYGYRIPVVMTKAAWADTVEWTRDGDFQDEEGRAWDVLTILRRFALRLQNGPMTSHVMRIRNRSATSGRHSKAVTPSACLLTFSAIAMDPSGQPCFMITLPGED